MEGNSAKLPEDSSQEENNLAEECLLDENLKLDAADFNKKSVHELKQEEEALRIQLDKLKKENFTLQASIKAWQTTLKNKLDEFKEADLKLDEIHDEIWSEREKFCSKADEFNDEYGVLSDWWSTQLKFVSDLENLEQKTLEDRKCRQEIEKLEKEVEELKRKIDGLEPKQKAAEVEVQVAEVEVHATADGEQCSPVRGEDLRREVSPGKPEAKKMRLAEAEDNKICNGREPTTADLYSIVDLERVRMVNRNRNRHRKGHPAGKS